MTVQEAKAKEVLNNIWDFADAQDEEKGDVVDDAVIEAIGCMEEVEQYRALGTVEELKEAREKQVAKEVVKMQIPNTSFSKAQTRYVCPICRKFYEGTDYCPKCGQALKRGEEDD